MKIDPESLDQGYMHGFADAVLATLMFIESVLTDKDLKRTIDFLISSEINGKARQKEMAEALRVRLDVWRSVDDEEQRDFAGRVLRSFGNDYLDHILFCDRK
jgi:hypothetical protein